MASHPQRPSAQRPDPGLNAAVSPRYLGRSDLAPHSGGPANLADILERVLDKGIVIAGDIQINLLDIELLTIRLRLLVASVDRAREMGIDWWEHDPSLSSGAGKGSGRTPRRELEQENRELRTRLDELERLISADSSATSSGGGGRSSGDGGS